MCEADICAQSVQDLHRSTDPVTDAEEHAKLGEAVQMISELAQYIDQSKRTSDNFLRLAEIQKKLHGLKEVHATRREHVIKPRG